MSNPVLSTFVKESLSAGASRDEIERVLLEAGWSLDQVRSALAEYSPMAFVVPVPRPKVQLSARDTFLYLVMFGMLYLAAYNLGSLLFQFVNMAFPDAASFDDFRYRNARIRFATSALLVSFPVFLFVSARINRQLQQEPVQRASAVRKWLTYLTLAIAACVVIGDLIALLNGLLSGDLTIRFVLKALIIGAISASIFFYYLWIMRSDDEALGR